MIAAATGNPLLETGGPPAFDRIRPEHVEPAIHSLVARLREDIEAFEESCAHLAPTFAARVGRLGELGEPLRLAWGTVQHLAGVCDSPALRMAREAVLPDVVALQLRIAQSRILYDSVRLLAEEPHHSRLDPAQRRVVRASLRDAELAGVALAPGDQERFRALALEHDQLCQRFENQLLDATAAAAITFDRPEQVLGLPERALRRAAEAAAPTSQAVDAARGPWRITLDGSAYVPFLEHAQDRASRERIYRAFITRASFGANDNAPVLERLLAIRAEQAHLLGHASYAQMCLTARMAPSVAAVDALLTRLAGAASRRAQQELDELRALASGAGAPDLALWDVPFWAERLRERRFDYRDEEVREYFPLGGVLEGLFAMARRLFGVVVSADDGAVPVWDAGVRYFRVTDEAGTPLAAFYLDPYCRPGSKRDGAWMDVCLDRRVQADGSVRLPVAYLICNQGPPLGGAPSLMSFREVVTLFHEFGHGLQHMLTRVDIAEAAGINRVEWDAVELPSQFLENWCYHAATLGSIAHHWKTGEGMPQELMQRLIQARSFRAGSATLRQVLFARVDLLLHQDAGCAAPGAALALQQRLSRELAVLPPLPEDRWLCGFSHVFPGGYAAGYYSYKWAEVLSADAFSAFEEAGLGDDAAIGRLGRRFRDTVLAQGGSRHPLEVFRDFRGREPSVEPLIRQLGLA